DVGAGAADPLPLDDGRPSPRPRHMPSQLLAALSAAKDQDMEPLCFRHELPPYATLITRGLTPNCIATLPQQIWPRCWPRVFTTRATGGPLHRVRQKISLHCRFPRFSSDRHCFG